jgi:hypothetical protein
MFVQTIEIVFDSEAQWIIPLQLQPARAQPAQRKRSTCLLPWICLALHETRSRRRGRKRRF